MPNITYTLTLGLNTYTYLFTPLADPAAAYSSSGVYTMPAALNNNGEVVGSYYDGQQWHGFSYTSGAYANIPDYPGSGGTFLTGVNDLGQVVGYYTDVNGGFAGGFIYQNGSFTALPVGIDPVGINDAGEIVSFNNQEQGVIYDNGLVTPLSDPAQFGYGTFTRPAGVNNLGQIVGDYAYAGFNWPFLYGGGSYTNPGSESVILSGINDNGLAVGANLNASASLFQSNNVGFVFDTSTQSSSFLLGPSQIYPLAINDAGQIVVTPVVLPGYAGILTLAGFFDDFNRPDGPVGNGWSYSLDAPISPVIANDALTLTGAGFAGIYRPVDLSLPITISADITQANGFGGGLGRYTEQFLFGSDGHSTSGYGIVVYGAGPSEALLVYNGVSIAQPVLSPFQFGSAVHLVFTLSPDGSINGTITEDADSFSFSFGPHPVQYTGSNFELVYDTGDNRSSFVTQPTIDNLSITENAANAPPPTVLSITPVTDNGLTELNAGRVVTITVKLSSVVSVTGNPSLQLSDNEVAAYVAGSGTDTLTFAYTVKQGDAASDLQVTALNLPNGATVRDATGQDLSGPVTQDLALKIDTTDPIVSSLAVSPSTGDFNAGHVLTITLGLSGPVKVKGTPTLTLNDGGTANYKAAASNPATGVLVFSYTVKAAENTANLAIVGVNSDSVGASVKDAAGHAADFSNAVTTFNGVQIDTTAPTVTSVIASGDGVSNGNGNGNGYLGLGSVVTLTVNFSEAVIVDTSGGVPTLNLNDGGGKATYAGGSGTSSLIFVYTVGPKENTSDLAVNALALNGGSITDGAGNKAVLTGAKVNPDGILQIDGTAPVVKDHLVKDSGSPNDGLTASAAIAGSGLAGGIVTLVIDGLTTVTALADSAGKWLFSSLGLTDGQHSVVASETDGAGNTGKASPLQFVLDQTPPTFTNISATSSSNNLHVGDTVAITLMMSESVTISGVPKLMLNDGGVASYDDVASDPLFNKLVFDYTVSKADIPVFDLQIVGGANESSIRDLAGNSMNATLTGDLGLAVKPPPPGGSLANDLAAAAAEIATNIKNGMAQSAAFHLKDSLLSAQIAADVATQFGSASNYTINNQGFINPTGANTDPSVNPDFDQCVALVLGLDAGVPPGTSTWTNGTEQIVLNGGPNPAIVPGTAIPIATFVDSSGNHVPFLAPDTGHYPGASEHAAMFLGYGVENGISGFFMLDQYVDQPTLNPNSQPAEVRFDPFSNANANEYYNIVPASGTALSIAPPTGLIV